MSSTPFDDKSGRFFVLISAEEQQCLWPGFAEIPDGWHGVFAHAGAVLRESGGPDAPIEGLGSERFDA